jgi:hypothetical protein
MLPPSNELKKMVPSVRSIASNSVPAARGGKANSIKAIVIRMDQVNTGSRRHVTPLARFFAMVTIKLIDDIETETAPANKIYSKVVKTEAIIIEIPEPDIKPAAAGYVASTRYTVSAGYAASAEQVISAGKPSAAEGAATDDDKAAPSGSFSVPAAESAGTAAKPSVPPGKPYATGWKFPAATAGRVAVVTSPPPPYTNNGFASAGAPAGISRKVARPANGIVRFGNGKHLG